MNSYKAFIGLGANLGPAAETLSCALRLISSLPGVRLLSFSPFYESDALMPEGAPPEWNIPFLNCAAECEVTVPMEKFFPALQQIELALGRQERARWAPREIDIDILHAGDTAPGLNIPHNELKNRPFALLPLYDIAPNLELPGGETVRSCSLRWLTSSGIPFRTRISNTGFTRLMGVVNVTPDSFSDGGAYADLLEHARELAREGAGIIDFGAESTRPHAAPITAEEEWRRLEPLLSRIKDDEILGRTAISADTRHPQTAEKALRLGVSWINDVSGGSPAMLKLAAERRCDIVLMHSLTVPADPNVVLAGEDPSDAIKRWAEKKLEECAAAGVSLEKVVIDPGVGFGKTAAQSTLLLREISLLQDLGVRILVGHSRKSFLGTERRAAERDAETAALSAVLAHRGVDWLRVHNVALSRRTIGGSFLVSRKILFNSPLQ